MTDRPPTAAPMLGTTVPADAGAPGYYPDPSVPGFVRYWAGHAWVPGTSRAAPAPGQQLQPPRFVARYLGPPPYAVPPGLAPAAPTGPLIETGPIYLDETGAHTAFNMPAHPGPVAPPPAPVESGPRAVEPVAPWAVSGGGMQPAVVESWATAAALRLGPVSVPEAAGASGAGASGVVGSQRVRPAEVREPAVEASPPGAEPVVAVEEVVEEAVPRPAQPLGGTPWHGGGDGEGRGGSVGMAAGSAPLYEPLCGLGAGSSRPGGPSVVAEEPAASSGWRADPRAQRGLMDTGEAPRRVSWGVDAAPGEALASPLEQAAARPEPQGAAAQAVAPETRAAAAQARAVAPETRAAAPAAQVTGERVRPPRESAAESRVAPSPGASPAGRARAGGGGGEQRRSAAPAAVPAGLAARAFGWLVDGAVTVVVGAAVAVPMAATVSEHVRKKIEQAQRAAQLTGRQHQVWLLDQTVLGRVGVVLGVLVLFALLYQVLPVARTGQTFGKRLARIRVVAAGGSRPPGFGRSLLRWLVGGLGTVLLAGLVAPLLDRPARRGWHDRAARTRVVRVVRR